MLAAVLNTSPLWGPERQMLEDAALIALARYHQMHGGYLRTLSRYNGELDTEEGMRALMTTMVSGCPAVLVAAAGSTYVQKSTTHHQAEEQLTIEILVGSQHARALPARLAGDIASGLDDNDPLSWPGRDPGIYRILRDIRTRLFGRQTNIEGAGAWELRREDVVIQAPNLTLWRAQYAVAYRWQMQELEDEPLAPVEGGTVEHHLRNYPEEPIGNPVITRDFP